MMNSKFPISKWSVRAIGLALGLLGSILLVSSAQAASDVATKISETKEVVQQLLEIKDDTTLSEPERQQLELQLKKNITIRVVDIAQAQIKEMREQMDKVAFPDSDDWNEVKKFVYTSIESYDTFYKESKRSLESNELSLEDVKIIAQRIGTKKNEEIDPFLQKATNISTTFGISEIVKRADERRKKVLSDVDKIYSQKLTTEKDLRDAFEKAAQSVTDARTFNNKAKEIMLNLYTVDATPLPSPIMDATSTIDPSPTPEPLSRFIELFDEDVAKFTGVRKSQVTNEHRDIYLKYVIKKSAEQIREAYNIFLQMSLSVKEFIQE